MTYFHEPLKLCKTRDFSVELFPCIECPPTANASVGTTVVGYNSLSVEFKNISTPSLKIPGPVVSNTLFLIFPLTKSNI